MEVSDRFVEAALVLFTHSVSHAHFSDISSLRGVETSRTRMAKGVCSAPYLSISPSPFSCFIRLLCCSRTVTSRPHSCLHSLCRTVPDPKARVKRTSARAAGSLATRPIPRTPQVVSPKSSTRFLLQTETRRLSTIRTTTTPLTSRKSPARTLDCSGLQQC